MEILLLMTKKPIRLIDNIEMLTVGTLILTCVYTLFPFTFIEEFGDRGFSYGLISNVFFSLLIIICLLKRGNKI